jgi:hypothetical protein
MSSLIRYGSYTPEALEADNSAAETISGDLLWKFDVGDNVYRVIPPPIGQDTPFRTTAMHYIELPGLARKFAFACPRHELKAACRACEQSRLLSRSPNPLDREEGDAYSAGLRIYMRVINRAIADILSATRVVGFGRGIQKDLKIIREDPRRGGDFTDPTGTGFDLITTRTGTGLSTRYNTAAVRGENSPLACDADGKADIELINHLIESQPDLEQFVDPVIPEELLRFWSRVSGQVSQDAPVEPNRHISARGGALADSSTVPQYDDNLDEVPGGVVPEEEEEDGIPF